MVVAVLDVFVSRAKITIALAGYQRLGFDESPRQWGNQAMLPLTRVSLLAILVYTQADRFSNPLALRSASGFSGGF